MHGLTQTRSVNAEATNQPHKLGRNTICYVYPSGKVVVSPRQSATEIAALELLSMPAQGDN